jgi:hypothetical protein
VRTASEVTAVQIVHSSRRGACDIEHLGSAHDETELEAVKPVVLELQRQAVLGQRLTKCLSAVGTIDASLCYLESGI